MATALARRHPARSLAAALVAALAACGDGAEPDGGAVVDGGAPGPAYLIGTRVWDESSTTSYFEVVDSLGADTEVDLGAALEVSGAAKLFAVGDVGWFAIGGGDAPTITRYTLGADDALVEDVTLSLQGYGVTSLWDTLYVVSPTKAYYPDRDGHQLIVWDPTAMEITGAIDLAETSREGYLALYGYEAIRRGDDLLFPVGWFDWTTDDAVLGETGLVVIDTATDALVRVDTDDRCGGVNHALTAADGHTYLVSSALAAAAHRLERLPTAPCALRIPADGDAIDPTYLTALADLTGAPITGEPVPGADGALYLRAFDEEVGTIGEAPATWELTGQPVWTWWRWAVGEESATRVDALDPSTADALWFQLDGRTYGSATAPDYAETTLFELGADGPVPGVTAPGFVHGVARIR